MHKKYKSLHNSGANFIHVTSGFISKIFGHPMFVTDDSQLVVVSERIMNVAETIAIRFDLQQHKQMTVAYH